jgi:hypothetical protein
MTDRSRRATKAALCLLAIVAYAYVYREYLRVPLMRTIDGFL